MHITLKCKFVYLSKFRFFYLCLGEKNMHTWEDFVSGEHNLCSCHDAPCCSLLTALSIAAATVSSAAWEICCFPERLRRLCKPTSCGSLASPVARAGTQLGHIHICLSRSLRMSVRLLSASITQLCRNPQKTQGLQDYWRQITWKLLDILPFLPYRIKFIDCWKLCDS